MRTEKRPIQFPTISGDLADLAAQHHLQTIPGIGRDLAEKIEEFLATGTIRAYEELKTPLPEEVAGWASLPGLSDALVSYLYFRLNIRTLADLETLVESHLLKTQPGFSGSEESLLRSHPRATTDHVRYAGRSSLKIFQVFNSSTAF